MNLHLRTQKLARINARASDEMRARPPRLSRFTTEYEQKSAIRDETTPTNDF